MKFLRFSQRVGFPLITVVLSGDLIYLYLVGGWYDPSKWIEITELACLILFIVLGITQTVMEVKRFKRDEL
jgi:hypothetical protein